MVTLTTDTFIESSWGRWIHFPLARVKRGGRNFSPQTRSTNGSRVPGLRIFTGQDLILRSLYLNLNLLCLVFPSLENDKRNLSKEENLFLGAEERAKLFWVQHPGGSTGL